MAERATVIAGRIAARGMEQHLRIAASSSKKLAGSSLSQKEPKGKPAKGIRKEREKKK